jgi:hypothetical protein
MVERGLAGPKPKECEMTGQNAEPFGLLFARSLASPPEPLPTHHYDGELGYSVVDGALPRLVALVDMTFPPSTTTETFTESESSDSDAPPSIALLPGMETVTEIEEETSDAYCDGRTTVPFRVSTGTETKVDGETSDAD